MGCRMSRIGLLLLVYLIIFHTNIACASIESAVATINSTNIELHDLKYETIILINTCNSTECSQDQQDIRDDNILRIKELSKIQFEAYVEIAEEALGVDCSECTEEQKTLLVATFNSLMNTKIALAMTGIMYQVLIVGIEIGIPAAVLSNFSFAVASLSGAKDIYPEILDIKINNGDSVHAGDDVLISARIRGSIQREIVYDDDACDDGWNECPGKIVDKDPELTYTGNNPAKIKDAYLFYFVEGNKNIFDEDNVRSILMKYNNTTGNWEANITKEQLQEDDVKEGTRLRYAIFAYDEQGRFLTEDLYPDKEFSSFIDDIEYALPSQRALCPDIYKICYDVVSLHNKPIFMTSNNYIPESLFGIIDLVGLSVKAGDHSLLVRLRTRNHNYHTNPQNTTYSVMIQNNNIVESNPDDFHHENIYIMNYSPTIVGTDPTQVRTLIDGSCLTELNSGGINIDGTPYFTYYNPGPSGNHKSIECIIKSTIDNNGSFTITEKNNEIWFRAPLTLYNPIKYEIAPMQDENVKPISITTNAIMYQDVFNSAKTILGDSIGGINYYHRVHIIDFKKGVPPAPLPYTINCNLGNDGKNSVNCGDSPKPVGSTSDVCSLIWRKTGTDAVTYNIYRGYSPDPELAQPIGMGLINNDFTDVGHNRDGKTYYYYISSVNECGETGAPKCGSTDPPNRSKWLKATCTTNYEPAGNLVCEPCVGATCP